MGSLSFQTGTLTVLCVWFLFAIPTAIHYVFLPHPQKMLVTEHGALSLSCEPSIFAVDPLVQEHFLYTDGVISS